MLYTKISSENRYETIRAEKPDVPCFKWPDARGSRTLFPDALYIPDKGMKLWQHLEKELPYPCGASRISFLILDSPELTAQMVDVLPVGTTLPAEGTLAYLWCDFPSDVAKDVIINIILAPVKNLAVEYVHPKFDTRKVLAPRMREDIDEHSRFVIYDGCKVFRQTKKGRYRYSRYPATTKDIWQFRPGSAGHMVFKAVFSYFAKSSKLWKDAYADFSEPSAYGSIPLMDIWECHNKKELFTKNYGYAPRRANKDSFGQNIFLARASRYVAENDLQKLYGYVPEHGFIGRRKDEIKKALWIRTLKMLQAADPQMTGPMPGLYHYYSDYFRFCDRLGEKICVDITSAEQLKKLHDDAAGRIRQRMRSWKITPDSPFRNLKLPAGWFNLTRQPELDEEGEVMHHCVATYGGAVKNGRSAIISRRIGQDRYTAEVCVGEDGKFYIEQFRAFANDDVPEEIWNELEEILKDQKPAGKRRKRRTKAEMEEARANGTLKKKRVRPPAKKTGTRKKRKAANGRRDEEPVLRVIPDDYFGPLDDDEYLRQIADVDYFGPVLDEDDLPF